MKNKVVFIRADGTVQFIGDNPPVPITGKKTTKRFSKIVPVSIPLRILFRLIRTTCGDHGRGAAWTRRWTCEWRATVLSTGQSFTHSDRAACTDWEWEQFNNPKFQL